MKKKTKATYLKKTLFLLLLLEGIVAFAFSDSFFSSHRSVSSKVLSASHRYALAHAASLVALSSSPSATPTVASRSTPSPTQIVTPQASGFCLRVPVLMYHHIQPLAEASKLGHAQLTVDSGIFDQQMSYLVAAGYTTLSSDQLVAALLGHRELPAKSIIVTLDDGYDDAYNYAFGIAKKYNINLDLMIPSGLINNPGYLNWNQLKEMSGNSLIHVYNHTWSHAALGTASKEKIEYEVTTAQNQLQSQLGKNTNVFVYPYGSFSPLAISILKEHGFIAGISTLPGTLQCDSYMMTLHRSRVGNGAMSSYGF